MKVGQHLSEHLQRREPLVRGTRMGIHALGNGVELRLQVDRQIGALGQVLAQQAIGVLAGAALPRAVRVAEIHTYTGSRRAQLGVPCHLPALVVGERLAHWRSNRVELGG